MEGNLGFPLFVTALFAKRKPRFPSVCFYWANAVGALQRIYGVAERSS